MASHTPLAITTSDPTKVEIEWEDGHRTSLTAAELRRRCPCAHCVDEVTGERLPDPTTIPDALTHLDVRLVGHYATSIRVSDQHDTGIFSFDFLRQNDPAR